MAEAGGWGRELWCTVMLLGGSIMDLRWRRIPRWYLLLGGIGSACLLLRTYAGDWAQKGYGVLPGAAVLLLGRLGGGCIGTADGGILLLLGMLYGGRACLVMLSYALLFAAAAAVLLVVLRHAGRRTRIPFYPFLFAAYLLYAVQTAGIG